MRKYVSSLNKQTPNWASYWPKTVYKGERLKLLCLRRGVLYNVLANKFLSLLAESK